MESKKKDKGKNEVKEQQKEHPRFVRKEFLFNDATKDGGELEFSIATYNILAQTYTRQENFPNCSHRYLRQKFRRDSLLKEINELNAEILCLQEIDFYEEFWEPTFNKRNYEGKFVGRKYKKDGCAIFFNKEKFVLKKTGTVDLDTLAETKRDTRYQHSNVGLFCELEFRGKGTSIVVATTHLFWDPEDADVKFDQLELILKCLQEFNNKKLPIILCGDLNSRPVYIYLQEGSVDKDHIDFLPPPEVVTLGDVLEAKLGISKPKTEEKPKEKLICPYQVKSAYSMHPEGEAKFTNFPEKFQGTLDYIFFEPERMSLKSILEVPPEEVLRIEGFLPNFQFSSDHVSLKATFKLK